MRFGQLPDTSTLEARLAEAFGCASVRVTERRSNAYSTTCPTEIATVDVIAGGVFESFLKYDCGEGKDTHGHRGGVAYEAHVHRSLLGPLGVSVPRFYGFFADGRPGQSLLVTEYMRHSIRVDRSTRAGAMRQAAHWIGNFQARGKELLKRRPVEGLTRYDRDYYVGWARRAEEATAAAGLTAGWLEGAFDGFRRSVDTLMSADATPVHGEYYPQNVLVQGDTVRPIDWETAAVGAGEIDIAALTERWPTDTALLCRRAYAQARWPGGESADWRRRLGLAGLYLHFRWIASAAWRDKPELWRLREVRSLSAELGFTPGLNVAPRA